MYKVKGDDDNFVSSYCSKKILTKRHFICRNSGCVPVNRLNEMSDDKFIQYIMFQ